MSLFNTVISGAKWTTMDSIVGAFLQITRVFILTKLLSPSDFGLMSLVLVITGLSKLFIDFGLKNAIIYKSENTKDQLSTLYWLNVFIGAFFTIAVFFFSGLISNGLFDEPRLEVILEVVSFIFVFNGFFNQYDTLLKKNLKFDLLAKINIFSTVLNFALTILLAFNGFGVYSLVAGYIIQTVSVGTLSILSSYDLFKPRFYFNLKEIKEYINFGGYQMLEIFTAFGQRQGDSILIGTFLSTETLGLYSVAKILIKRPIELVRSIIDKMAFPVFAKIKEAETLRKWAVSSQKAIFLSLLPILLLLISFPEFVVQFVYGEKWLDAIPILRLLTVMFSVRLLRSTFGPILLSRGKAAKSFQLNFWVSLIYLAALWIGLKFSINYAIVILIFTELLAFQFLNYRFILRPILKFSLRNLLSINVESYLPLIIGVAVTYPFIELSNFSFHILSASMGYLLGLLSVLVSYYFLNQKSINHFKMKFLERKKLNNS